MRDDSRLAHDVNFQFDFTVLGVVQGELNKTSPSRWTMAAAWLGLIFLWEKITSAVKSQLNQYNLGYDSTCLEIAKKNGPASFMCQGRGKQNL